MTFSASVPAYVEIRKIQEFPHTIFHRLGPPCPKQVLVSETRRSPWTTSQTSSLTMLSASIRSTPSSPPTPKQQLFHRTLPQPLPPTHLSPQLLPQLPVQPWPAHLVSHKSLAYRNQTSLSASQDPNHAPGPPNSATPTSRPEKGVQVRN